MRESRILIVTVASVLASAAWFGLRAQQSTGPDQAERAKAVQAVRLINTAEVVYFSGSKKGSIDTHGRFGSWDELNQSGVVKALESQWNLQLSTSDEIMPGWHLDLLVSADGKSWLIALHDKRDGDKLFSVFSDASGIIYLGAPMQ